MMSINIFRVISVITSAILMVAVGFAFFTLPHIGSAYLLVTNKLGSELPLITKHFSLAFIGNHDNIFSAFPERTVWAWCMWFILCCWPIALMIWALRASDFERTAAKWCLGVIAYLSLVITVAAIVNIGLVMPFTRLK